MIVTKQRKSYQSINPQNTAEKYIQSSSPYEQKLSRDYRLSVQTVSKNYDSRERERGSIGKVSPISKNNHNVMHSYSKKSQKKYDYSVNLQRTVNKQFLNRTHDKIRDYSQHSVQDKNESSHVSFLVDGHQKRRYSSTNEKTPKYNYTVTKEQTVNRDISEVLKSCNKLSSNPQKIDIKEYLKGYEPKHQTSLQISNRSSVAAPSYNENREDKNRVFFGKNRLEDNFIATDKFLQFKTQKKPQQNDQSNSRSKYQSHLSRMRNNKKYQVVKEEQENIAPPKRQNYTHQKKPQKEENQVNFQNLLKNSLVQNTKIHEKISRISKLNQQINLRLNQMLHRQKVV